MSLKNVVGFLAGGFVVQVLVGACTGGVGPASTSSGGSSSGDAHAQTDDFVDLDCTQSVVADGGNSRYVMFPRNGRTDAQIAAAYWFRSAAPVAVAGMQFSSVVATLGGYTCPTKASPCRATPPRALGSSFRVDAEISAFPISRMSIVAVRGWRNSDQPRSS